MSIFKKLFVYFCASIMLTACATKVSGPEAFKNYTAKQILAGGEAALAKHNYKEAAMHFEAIEALYPFDLEAQRGQLGMIYAYYKADDYASALATADRYIHLYPAGKHTDYAYYMKGIVNFEKDRNWLQKIYTRHSEELDLVSLQESFADFEILVKRFPKSFYAKDAEKRMLHIRDMLAKRELQTAKFYFDRNAYIAAANRASYIVKHLEGASQMADALKIMIKSYRALGADKQASDTLRILNLNFPKERI